MPSLLQASMAAGEISPQLYFRVDLQRWATSLKLCRNMITLPTGGVKNRAGTILVGEAKDSTHRVRLIPFRRSADQSYVLEVGHHYVRVIYQGGYVTTSPYAAMWFSGIEYGIGARVSNGSFNYVCLKNHLSSASFVNDFNAGCWQDDGSVGLPEELETTYASNELFDISYAQMADVMTLAHQSHHPANISRYGANDFRLADVVADSGPWRELNMDLATSVFVDKKLGDITITANKDLFVSAQHVGRLIYIEQRNYGIPWESGKTVTAGAIRRSDGKYYEAQQGGVTGTIKPIHEADVWNDGGVEWRYLHSGYGVARITEVTDAKHATATVVPGSRMPDELSITGYGTPITASAPNANAISISPGATGTVIFNKVAHGMTAAVNGTGLVTLTNPGYSEDRAYTLTVVDADHIEIHASYSDLFTGHDMAGPDFTGVSAVAPRLSSGVSTYRWKFGAWQGDQGYPGMVAYHQNRRTFGSTPTQPHTVWMSRSNAYIDFSTTTPTVDDDAITFDLASGQIDDVRFIVSMDKLVLLTEGAEWVLGTGSSDVITPGNLNPKPQGYHGVANLAPIAVGDAALFVQRKGWAVRDLDFDYARDKYVGNDLTIFASHLTENNAVVDWAYQQHPFSVVWMVLSDGTLAGLTYMKEQQVAGWHRHDTEGGKFESVCCVSEGDEDVVYFVVNRGGVRYIERMANRVLASLTDSFFVDSGLSYDGTKKSTLTPDGFDYSTTTITLTGGTLWNEAEALTLVLNHNLLTGSSVGDAFVLGDGTFLSIVGYSSPTQCSVVPDRTLAVGYRGVATKDWSLARDTFQLAHLQNTEIAVCADAQDVGPFTTDASGFFTLTRPAVRVAAGLPIVSDGQTLGVSAGDNETALDKKITINSVRAAMLETNYLMVGRDFDHLRKAKQQIPSQYGVPLGFKDGLVEVNIDTSASKDGSFVFRNDKPMPFTLTALIPEVQVGGV